MKKFVTAYISFFDHGLNQEIVEAASEYDALIAMLQQEGYDFDGYDGDKKTYTIEQLKSQAFDCDCMISAIEIN